MKATFGIDPGKSGALVILFEDRTAKIFKFPKIGLDIDERALWEVFKKIPDDAVGCIEMVHSIHGTGAKSNFEFGGTYFMLRMALAARGLPYKAVPPKNWQKHMFSGLGVIKKAAGGTDTKAMALKVASELYPNISFLDPGKPRAYTPDDGIVDALLLAEYARQTM
jgi:hypothetical protein